MATLQKIYSDIDFTFTKKPVSADVALSYDSQAVIRSVRNLLLTKHYARPFNPDLGSNVGDMLFENFSNFTASRLEKEITTVIERYEPRVILQSVVVSMIQDKNSYEVRLTFYLQNSTSALTTTLLLERTR